MIISHFAAAEIMSIGGNPTCGFCALCDLGNGAVGVMDLVFAKWQLFDKRHPDAQDRDLICSGIDGKEQWESLRCLMGDSIERVSAIYREMSDGPDFGFHVLVGVRSGRLLYAEPYKRPDEAVNPPMCHAPMIVFSCAAGKQTFEFSGNVRIERAGEELVELVSE